MKKGNFCSDLIIKSAKKNNTLISGYASVFNIPDSQNDIIAKGAFISVDTNKVKLLWQHDSKIPIGVVTSLSEDDYGLKVSAEINNQIVMGKEASELIKQKAICGLSIGFSINSSHYNHAGVRVIDDLNLIEISVVTFPSNHQAEITDIKNQVLLKEERRTDIEDLAVLVKKLQKY